MGEGKPLGALLPTQPLFDFWCDLCLRRESLAPLRSVLARANSPLGCSARAESIESRDSLRKRFFLLKGKRRDGKGTFWQEFRKMIFAACARRAIWSPLRGSGSFCVSVAAISGVAARSITRNPPRSKSIRRRSCGIASVAAKAETFSAS